MTPTEQKTLLDAIARAAFGWTDDGTRHTYVPDELPAMVARLRMKAEHYVAIRDGKDIDEPPGWLGALFKAEPQGAPHATLEEAWDEGFEEGEGARRENPYRQKTKGASVRVSRVDGEPIGIELPGPQGAPTCCQGTDCGRCVGCLRVAKGAPQKPEQET